MRATGWLLTAAILTTPVTTAVKAQAQSRPDQKAFLGLYKELVETNTTLSSGSCTQAAAQIGARLKTAGYADAAITYFSVPEHPEGRRAGRGAEGVGRVDQADAAARASRRGRGEARGLGARIRSS